MTAAPDLNPAEHYWQRNLAVCALGSFTTIIAMTLLLPFLPLYVEQLGIADPADIAQWSGWHLARPSCRRPLPPPCGGAWAIVTGAS